MSGPMWIEGIIENAVFRQTNGNSFAVWLAAHDAEVRAGVITEEPEWEYGWDAQIGFEPNQTPTREKAEEVIGRNPGWVLVKRAPAVPAGPWVPVEP